MTVIAPKSATVPLTLRLLGPMQVLIHGRPLPHLRSRKALGHMAREVGDYAQATTFYQESLLLRQEQGDVLTIACSLEDFAGLAGRQGQYERAVRLLGAAEVLCGPLGRTLPVAIAEEYERTVAGAHATLGDEAFAATWEEGRAMTLEQAVAYALKHAND